MIGIAVSVYQSDHVLKKEERERWSTPVVRGVPKYDYEPSGLFSMKIHNAPFGVR